MAHVWNMAWTSADDAEAIVATALQHRPEIVIIGRTSDPPSIIVPIDGTSATTSAATIAGGDASRNE